MKIPWILVLKHKEALEDALGHLISRCENCKKIGKITDFYYNFKKQRSLCEPCFHTSKDLKDFKNYYIDEGFDIPKEVFNKILPKKRLFKRLRWLCTELLCTLKSYDEDGYHFTLDNVKEAYRPEHELNELKALCKVTPEGYFDHDDDFERMDWLCERLRFTIISYGLAPNPTGYCYEDDDPDYTDRPPHLIDELNDLCMTARQGYIKGGPHA